MLTDKDKNTTTSQRTTKTTSENPAEDERMAMIQTAAYFRAEKRGFQGGDPVQDWIDAEREVDTMLKSSPRKSRTRTN